MSYRITDKTGNELACCPTHGDAMRWAFDNDLPVGSYDIKPLTQRVAVISRATRVAAWAGLIEHLSTGNLDNYDRIILQSDDRGVAYVTLLEPHGAADASATTGADGARTGSIGDRT